MDSPSLDDREALLVAHGRSSPAARLLVRAFDALSPPPSQTLDELDKLERFSTVAHRAILSRPSIDESKQRALLEDISSLLEHLPGMDASMLDEILPGLNWPELCTDGRSFYGRSEELRQRAEELGLLPSPVRVVSEIGVRAIYCSNGDERVRHAILRDPEVAAAWWKQMSREKEMIRRIGFARELFKRASDAGKDVAMHINLCCQEFGFDSQGRRALEARPHEAISAASVGRRLLGGPGDQPVSTRADLGALDRLFLRRGAGIEELIWPGLESESPSQLVDLIIYWMSVLVASEYRCDQIPEVDAIKLLGPLMQAVLDGGAPTLRLLASRLLADPPRPDEQAPDWREALFNLHGAVDRRVTLAERSRRNPPAGTRPEDLAAHRLSPTSSLLVRELSPHMTQCVLSDAGALESMKGWLLATKGKQSVHRQVAPQLARVVVESIADRLNVDIIAELTSHAREHDVMTETVLQAAHSSLEDQIRSGSNDARSAAAKLAVKLLQLAVNELDDNVFVRSALSMAICAALTPGPDLSAADGSAADAKVDPELVRYVDGIPPSDPAAMDLIRGAKALARKPAILGGLIAFFMKTRHDIQKHSHYHITIPGPEKYESAGHCDLADLLYATGNLKLNPPKECSWPRIHRHLSLWHLGRGHDIRTFFIDAWQPHYGPARWGTALLGGCDPDMAVDALAEILPTLPKDQHREFLHEALRLLDHHLNRSSTMKQLLKRSPGWERYAPGTISNNALTRRLPLGTIPATRMKSLEHLLATTTEMKRSGRLADDAWALRANLALILSEVSPPDESATFGIETELKGEAKQLLMDARASEPSSRQALDEIDFAAALAVVNSCQGIRPTLRHLLILYRGIPEPCVPPSLSPEAFDEVSDSKWACIPKVVSSLLSSDLSDDQVKDLRYELGDYLQKRLKTRKRVETQQPDDGSADEQHSMVERSRHVRRGYTEALWSIRTSIDSHKITKLLRLVEARDPSEDVQGAAKTCLARKKPSPPSVADRKGLMMGIWQAWWWIRHGITARFGDSTVNWAKARETLAKERRSTDR